MLIPILSWYVMIVARSINHRGFMASMKSPGVKIEDLISKDCHG